MQIKLSESKTHWEMFAYLISRQGLQFGQGSWDRGGRRLGACAAVVGLWDKDDSLAMVGKGTLCASREEGIVVLFYFIYLFFFGGGGGGGGGGEGGGGGGGEGGGGGGDNKSLSNSKNLCGIGQHSCSHLNVSEQ